MNQEQDWQMIVEFWRMFKHYSTQSPVSWEELDEHALGFANRHRRCGRFAKDLMLSLAAEIERRETA